MLNNYTLNFVGYCLQFFALPRKRTTLVFDIDSVVIVIYGKQAGARVGYNPKKHGRRSYHPIFCFEAHFQEFWHGSLRPGDAGASTGAVPFIKRCLVKVPKEYIGATLDTIRTDFLVLPSQFVRKHNRNIVKLPHDYHYQKEFLEAGRWIEKLKLREKFRFCK
ncbi:MAG: transposase [Elusimicrobia bacterium]|nr:transposase [Elusimicrobiota bacterium]